MNASLLRERCKEHQIKFLLVSFSDIYGVIRAKLVPVSAIDALLKNGAAFAGFAAHFNLTPAHPDIVVQPDVATFTPLPWKPGVAWLTGDLYMAGRLLDQSPRNQLKLNMAQEQAHGRVMKSGVEAEFFLLDPHSLCAGDKSDRYHKPCYDQSALMRRYDVISEICESIDTLGWQPYQNDHEDANGQFEINWAYSDALHTADRHTFFKFAVKSIAEKHQLRASFMPKIFDDLTGNGCHIHCSVWNNDENLFIDRDYPGKLSPLGMHFIGGILQNGAAISPLTNPSVNSYKRLNANHTSSGATWVSHQLSWSGDNRTHAVRIPGPGRIEYRIPDGAANPYLLQLGILAAGAMGIENRINPGEPGVAYRDGHDGQGRLPANLRESLDMLSANSGINAYIGSALSESVIALRSQQWRSYEQSVSQWEHHFTLDC